MIRKLIKLLDFGKVSLASLNAIHPYPMQSSLTLNVSGHFGFCVPSLMVFCLLLLFSLVPETLWAEIYSGQVVDALTGDGISGAEIIDQTGQKFKTDQNGHFTLDTSQPEIIVNIPGFQAKKATLKPEKNLISLSLKGVYRLGKVEVKAKPDAKKVVVSKQRINKEEIKKTTTTLFPDVVSVVQMLPGVAMNNDFSSLLYVRGGDPDEVIAVLDNMVILFPYLWGGRLSIFNPNLVEEVEFSTGGFPAEWPQAMSAILNVRNRTGNTEEYKGFFDLSAATFDLFFEGPLAGNLGGAEDSSFIVGLRRTDYDLIIKLFSNDNLVYPYFYDGQAKFSLPFYAGLLTANTIFSVEGMDFSIKRESGYGSNNADDFDFHYLDRKFNIGLSYDAQITDAVSVMTLAGLLYRNGFYKLISAFSPFDVKQEETIFQLRNTWQMLLGEHQIIKAGFNFFPGLGSATVRLSYKVPLRNGTYYINSVDEKEEVSYYYTGAFIQDDIEILEDRLYLNPGVNMQYYSRTQQWIGNPRAAFKVKITPDTEAYFATGLYSQYALEGSTTDENTGNPHILAEESIHYILGTKVNIGEDFFVQLETYYKDYRNLVTSDPDPGVNYTNNEIGYAYGFDVILQKKLGGNWDGWLTYSYVTSRRKITQRNDPRLYDKPEAGTPLDTWFTADSDRPHVINLLCNYNFSDKWKLALTQKYASGKPVTPIEGAAYQPAIDEYIPNSGLYNSERLPDYLTTDIKLTMPFFGLKGWSSYVQITNLFDIKNVDSYQYKTDYSDKRPIYQLPRMFFGGFRYEF